MPHKSPKCLWCGKPARIKFCCNAHKDKWHNAHNPRGIGIRPARSPDDDIHPFDPEAFGGSYHNE